MEATAVQPLEAQLAEIRGSEPRGRSSHAYVDLMADVLSTLDDGHLVPYLRNSPHAQVTVALPDNLPLQFMRGSSVYAGDRLRVTWPLTPRGKTVLQVGASFDNHGVVWSEPLVASRLKNDGCSIASLNTPEELASGFADLTDDIIQILDDQMELEAQLWMETRAVEP